MASLACGSGGDDSSSTHEVVEASTAGVCMKLDALSCAQPNCEPKFALAQKKCAAEKALFQDLLDCMAVATFKCSGSPNVPRTEECQQELLENANCFD